jgi:hypothetical protein
MPDRNTLPYDYTDDVELAPTAAAGVVPHPPRRPLDAVFVQMLEALSHRVLRHWDAQAWRDLFLGSAHASIRFRRASLTLLLADSPLPGMKREEAGLLASRLRAEAEVAGNSDVGLAFREPAAALRAALLLQRLAVRANVRGALTVARCTVASFELGGVQRQLVIGPEVERAQESVLAAPPGTVLVSGDAYALVADELGEEARDAIVATELHGEQVTRASITLAPRPTEFCSTFAGLGQV